LIFNRKDDLHNKLFGQVQEKITAALPTHYLPSSEKFADFISSGFAYGMLPDQHSRPLLKAGKIIDLAPGCKVAVKLYWHCWNLESRLLKKLSRTLADKAVGLLAQ